MRAIAAALFLAAAAQAEPPAIQFDKPLRCERITLDPGVYLPKPTYEKLDTEVRRLQSRERELEHKLQTRDGATVKAILIAAGVGFVVGAGGVLYLNLQAAKR